MVTACVSRHNLSMRQSADTLGPSATADTSKTSFDLQDNMIQTIVAAIKPEVGGASLPPDRVPGEAFDAKFGVERRVRVFKQSVWAVTATICWLALALLAESARADTYQLLVSFSGDRSAPVPLQGATVAGDIFVFTCRVGFVQSPECDDGVTTSTDNRANFFLDGIFVRGERQAPYDFGGGSANTAKPFNTATIVNGSHTITAELPLTVGGTAVVEATFTVGN